MEKGTGIQLIQQMAAASRNLRNELEVSFENIGLTANQAMVIHYIASAKGRVSPRDIEARFQITHPSVSRILRNLESKGYVTVETDPEDGRCHCITLTAQAQKKIPQIDDQIVSVDRTFTQALTGEEIDILKHLLGKLTQ